MNYIETSLKLAMDFGAFRRAGFYAAGDLDEANFGANEIRVVLPIERNIWMLVATNSFPPVLPVSDY